MEVLTDITATINEADYDDPVKLRRILQYYNSEKQGSHYIVKCSYQQLEKLSVKLSIHFGPSSNQRTGQQASHSLPTARSLNLSEFFMLYIQQRCAKELQMIQGNSFVIETHAEENHRVQVTVRPALPSTDTVGADLVRQRLFTFYQRTAADLQVTTVTLSPCVKQKVERRFPELLFQTTDKNKVSVTGPFVHVAELEKFLLQNGSPPTDSPMGEDRSSRTSVRTLPTSKALEKESCPICMDVIVPTEKKILRCKHSFCRECLKKAFQYKPVCPTCGQIYGTLTGNQPEGGSMTVTTNSSSLPGYEGYGTIVIQYDISSGIQKDEHPNPGLPYTRLSRTAYLPDSTEGKQILDLLKRAFDQRLIFTVGRSSTSGRNNTVTWNDIHHKTSIYGGPTCYGYPDPEYMDRVRDELKAKGIE